MSFVPGSESFEPSYRNTDPFLAIPDWNDQDQSESLVADDLLFSQHKGFENPGREIETSRSLLDRLRVLQHGPPEERVATLSFVLACVQHQDERVRVEAVDLLGMLDDLVPLFIFLRALKDPFWDVRAAAAQALGQRQLSFPLSWILQAFKEEQDMNVREALIRAIGRHPEHIPIQQFCDLLRDDPNWLVREAVAWSLGQLESEQSRGVLLRALRCDKDETVRVAAARSLMRSEHADVEEALYWVLEHDPDQEVQETVALVLQQRDVETHDWSYHILQDQDRELFHTDMETLLSAHVSAHRSTVYILSALTQFFSEKQGWVSRSQLMPTAQGLVLWIDCVYQEGGHVLQEVIFPLCNDARFVAPLDAALQSSDQEVRQVVAQILTDHDMRACTNLFVIACSFASAQIPTSEVVPFRIILSGMGCERVRENDVSVMNNVVDVLTKLIPDIYVSQSRPSLSNLKIWHQLDFELLMQQYATYY